ncbi:bifunctional phosphopantothenoylcysteine decarboxylase/phosphopantothenate--cysteine ligase CoaBC [Liquorilactobacillus satsumensis]|uniref:bifunctional phosphopantothenoylcysteine decarboxylase/phosphopantothenate--cysteine ligase CoaBC n=1 Tax=Liquorilactobacillus satsumensis TaxID=259059 RepID=UPI001E615B4F|nr:bifunctional phosphopantothenoylcysteine decarboxylase/phosphopantothenate--cysteine ligase CoaBC [Liquorilactobacillus satsumensis]MCC7665628.1 bifunctional phosphopantothenoylcysteine decarboxylase/phosphopantothenate--cysteine ligase CoaBC [Liquorilactobacillus satsumensis]MCP9311840.1 bifunctional phosphopantothenoylcysteine decarboxylase/phosphopantothenate--cysteine ligase CoaBC [Liquorilactobacillus satsumensis]MCP9358013.1 bifunctional phosphopantothenoylcysteine decarboxylase/phospho
MKNQHVAVYVTGGIAAYKAAFFVREMIKKGAQVKVALTKSACAFVTPLTFQTLSQNPVYIDGENSAEIVPHIELAVWSDLAVVIPATANLIAKMATGIADDFVSSALLASACPKFVVPAMNDQMYYNPATQRNLKQLMEDGICVLEPATGFLAEGYTGKGRLPEIEQVVEWLTFNYTRISQKQDLKNKQVLITAGGTIEPLDPVRYLTNRSSGKMGYALAENALLRGATVILISAPTQLKPPFGAKVIAVQTALEMAKAVETYYSKMDIVIMAAAVSDYRAAKPAAQKIKKKDTTLALQLVENPDILLGLGAKKKQQLLVGFAAETQQLVQNAAKKMVKKRVDLLVANDVSRSDIGFGSNQNEVTFLRPHQKPLLVKKTTKEEIAAQIFDVLLSQ